jgi:hypothetical protein
MILKIRVLAVEYIFFKKLTDKSTSNRVEFLQLAMLCNARVGSRKHPFQLPE